MTSSGGLETQLDSPDICFVHDLRGPDFQHDGEPQLLGDVGGLLGRGCGGSSWYGEAVCLKNFLRSHFAYLIVSLPQMLFNGGFGLPTVHAEQFDDAFRSGAPSDVVGHHFNRSHRCFRGVVAGDFPFPQNVCRLFHFAGSEEAGEDELAEADTFCIGHIENGGQQRPGLRDISRHALGGHISGETGVELVSRDNYAEAVGADDSDAALFGDLNHLLLELFSFSADFLEAGGDYND